MPSIWVLEDQLSPDLPPLRSYPDAPVLMIESDRAFRQFGYHKKRITFLCSAMRHFADELRSMGRTVDYHPLKADNYLDSLSAVRRHFQSADDKKLIVTDPADHHTRTWIESLPRLLGVDIEFVPSNLFLIDKYKFADWARSQKSSPVMERFYRLMRVKHKVLMNPDRTPVGGQWNFDKLNRKPAPGGLLMPAPPSVAPDPITRDVMAEIARRFPGHPGDVDGFDYAVTRVDAEAQLRHFLDHKLALFGDWEDAMLADHPLLYHSRLSPLLNAGLIKPMACVRGAERRHKAGKAPINAVEGFIRQILGWREYMFGIYHTYMPEYRDRNSRRDDRPLPDWFWTGDTDMHCLRRTITDLVKHAHTHHIQRLMVICNFATLVGLSPQAVNDWFLQMYVDSHDWVVTPNVIGMGMNADGGTCATKPYVSSANYINRMSDYCRPCKYDPKQRTGPKACPFNYLYWTFLEDHRVELRVNGRVAAVLTNLDRMEPAQKRQMRDQREALRSRLAAAASGEYVLKS